MTFTGPAYKDMPAPLADAPYTYRGVAKASEGCRRSRATDQSAEVWAPEFRDEFGGTRLSDQWADRQVKSKECAKVGDPRARKVAAARCASR